MGNPSLKKNLSTAVLIIGGGLSGLSLAGVLANRGISAVVVDRDDPQKQLLEKYDGRTTAISYASHKVLETAGVWKKILPHCCPILDIRVADGASPLFLHFDSAEDAKGNPFGWIIENQLLRRALFENIKKHKKLVRHLAPAEIKEFFREETCAGVILKDGTKISAALLVGADGRNSAVREWLGIETAGHEYGQSAIVCNVEHEIDHENAAVEHFLPAGPFAVLPMTKSDEGKYRSSVVWTVEGKDAEKKLRLPPKEFDRALQKLFGPHLGKVHHVSKPMAYPLRLMHAKSYAGPRTLLIAEAAHVIHPIAGQGLNVSMRDIAVLAELVADHLKLGLDIGSASILEKYEQWRRPDTLTMAAFTEVINGLFSNPSQTLGLARDTGLGIVQKIPPLKRFFATQAMGLGGKLPRGLGGKLPRGLGGKLPQ